MKFGCKIFLWTLPLWSFLLCGGEVSFVISADLHGRLDKLVLLAPQIKRFPEAVKVDLGDFCQGNYECAEKNGLPVIAAFNMLGYDLLVPGNHDLEYPPEVMRQWNKTFRGRILTGQWELAGFSTAAQCIIRKGNYRIGVIALGDVGLKKRQPYWKELGYRDERVAASLAAAGLRGKCDVMVLMCHISTSNYPVINGILNDIPEIVAVVGAHSHRELAGGIIRDVLVTSPSPHAESAVLLKLLFDDRTGKFNYARSELLLPQNDADEELLSCWQNLQKECAVKGDELLAEFRNVREFGIAGAEAIRKAAGTQMAMIAFDHRIFRPQISRKKLFQIFPYGNRIAVVKTDKEAVDKLLKRRKRKGERFFVSGRSRDGVFTLAVSDYILLREPLLRRFEAEITPLFERQVIAGELYRRKTGGNNAE